MKIMTAMYTIKRGGAYDRFLMMLQAFVERGCHVHCLSLTPIPIDHPLYSNHVVSSPLRARTGFVAKVLVFALFPFYLLVLGWRERVDLIVAFGPLYAFLQALPKWVLKKTMVTFVRSDLSSRPRASQGNSWITLPSRLVDRIGVLCSDRIITNNMASREKIIVMVGRRRERQVSVLYNNIPPIPRPSRETISYERRVLGIPDDGKLLVTAGVVTPGKNFELLLRSLSRGGMTNVFLAIVGDGTTGADFVYRDQLKGLAKELDIRKKLFFTGWLKKDRVWQIFRASDLFVLPSLSEGMPNVLLEALGCEVACFGSNIPGIRDILRHETLMFDPDDDKGLTEKLGRFFSDEDYRRRIMQLCYEQREKFSFDWKERVFVEVTKQKKCTESQE